MVCWLDAGTLGKLKSAGAALYKKPPSKKDRAMMKFLGLTPDDYAEQNCVEVWPDNWPAVMFFQALGNGAWNMGAGGPIGLRPEAFREIRLAQRIRAADWPALLADIRVLEDGALDEIHKDD
jgi:hypothetical protein